MILTVTERLVLACSPRPRMLFSRTPAHELFWSPAMSTAPEEHLAVDDADDEVIILSQPAGPAIVRFLGGLIKTVFGLVVLTVVGAVLYMIFHSVFLQFQPAFGWIGSSFTWATDIITTLNHPRTSVDIAQNKFVTGAGSWVIVYLLSAAILYWVTALFSLSRGWRLFIALFAPLAFVVWFAGSFGLLGRRR